MKISYRTHSVIKQIESGNLAGILIDDDDIQFLENAGFNKTWKLFANKFNKIKIITKPFNEALELSIGKLWGGDLWHEHYEDSGTFMKKQNNGRVDAWCYDFVIRNGIFEHLILFYFHNDHLVEFVNQNLPCEYVTDSVLLNGVTAKERIKYELEFLYEFFLFTKYAELQIKELPPKSRKIDIDCKYINDTSSNIKILDSLWFTSLIKSDAFKVRGHFRLQPHGQGMKGRKLIWLNEFQKDGYTRRAGKLIAEENNL